MCVGSSIVHQTGFTFRINSLRTREEINKHFLFGVIFYIELRVCTHLRMYVCGVGRY